MRPRQAIQLAAIEVVWRIEGDPDAFLCEQQLSDFLPGLTASALLLDELEVRFKDAVIGPAAALSLCRLIHRGTL
jgi:hypothetical protein